MSTIIVRPERSFEQFSRGLELVQAIKAMWAKHTTDHRTPLDHVLDEMDLMEEFDLDLMEWLYWTDLTGQVKAVAEGTGDDWGSFAVREGSDHQTDEP